MNIPTTYIEWIKCFEYVKDHPRNEMYIDILNKGILDYDENLISKLANELSSVITYRLSGALNTFTESLKGTIEYNSLSLEIISLRKEFNYAFQLGNIKVFPDNVKEGLIDLIKKNADNMQKALEENTKMSDRSGTINSMIKNNPINVFK